MTTDLQEAFREAARREFAMVLDENELDYTFSLGFQRKMQRIIRAQVHGYWNMVNTLGKRIAIAAAIIVMLLTTAMAIKPVRERVIKFFVEVYEEYFEITFGEKERGDLDATQKTMTRYTFSWVPENYQFAEYNEFDTLLFTTWRTDNGQKMLLSQGMGTQDITLNHTGELLIEFKHGDLLIYHNTTANEMIWEQYGYVFKLTIPDDISMNNALRIIDSLSNKE